jgi:hypothetical protein
MRHGLGCRAADFAGFGGGGIERSCCARTNMVHIWVALMAVVNKKTGFSAENPVFECFSRLPIYFFIKVCEYEL